MKFFKSETTIITNVPYTSGFDWNCENSTIAREKSAYYGYVKVVQIIIFANFLNESDILFLLLIFFTNVIQNHKEATARYGKPFPFFNDHPALHKG